MNRKIKDKILELRSEGKSYKEIAETLNCSRSAISYHCGEGQKDKYKTRLQKRRDKHPFLHKIETFLARKINLNKIQISNRSLNLKLSSKLNNFTKKGEGKMTEIKLQDVINKFGNNPTCYITGDPININDTKSYHFDHIIPVSRGGDNSLENLGICTKKANLAKGDMTPNELIEFCKLVLQKNNYKILENAN